MTSRSKEFEYDDGNYSFGIDLNEELGTFKSITGFGKNIDDYLYKEEYEFRVINNRNVEVKLIDETIEDAFGHEVAHHVKGGVVSVEEIEKTYSTSVDSRDEKLLELSMKVQWHEEKNYIVLLCLLNRDKKAVEAIKHEIKFTRDKLNDACKNISNELVSKFQAELDLNSGWVKIKNIVEIKEKLDDYIKKNPGEFGISNWNDFFSYPARVDYYNRILGDSLKIISSDVWTDEILNKEIEENISNAFPDHEENHCLTFLDGRYLKSNLNLWIRTALQKIEVKKAWKYFDDYGRFLSDADCALNGGGKPKPNSEFAYPALAQVDELERVTGEYLKNKEWHSEYFDWILIGVFLQRETIAFTHEVVSSVNRMGFFQKMKLKESIKSAGDLVTRYAQLSQISESKTYSLNELLDYCREVHLSKGFIHPCVTPLIENRIDSGQSVLTFPSEARTPAQMEIISAKKERKLA